jgi:hypothetical protein
VFRLYEGGILNIKQAKEALKVKRLYNQFVFKTQKSLDLIKFIQSDVFALEE